MKKFLNEPLGYGYSMLRQYGHDHQAWSKSNCRIQLPLRKLLNRVLCDVSGAGESKRQPVTPVSQVRGDMATE